MRVTLRRDRARVENAFRNDAACPVQRGESYGPGITTVTQHSALKSQMFVLADWSFKASCPILTNQQLFYIRFDVFYVLLKTDS